LRGGELLPERGDLRIELSFFPNVRDGVRQTPCRSQPQTCRCDPQGCVLPWEGLTDHPHLRAALSAARGVESPRV